MRSVGITWCLLWLFCTGTQAQVYKGQVDFSKIPVPGPHYQEEYTFDSTVNVAAWNALKKGMHVSFASTDELYFRTEVPSLNAELSTWSATGWKGERLNAQILVWTPDTISQVHFVVNDLKSEKGITLSKKNIQLDKVCYVLSNYPYNANDASCGGGPVDQAYLLPDRFAPLTGAADRFDVPGKTVRPVWLSINVPPNAEAGIYIGKIGRAHV